MSFLHVLDVVEYRTGGARLLILWMDPVSNRVATVDLSQGNSWPVLSDLSELEAAVGDMADLALRREPLPPGVTITERDKTIRDTACGIISPIVTSEPQVFDRLPRARMIAEAMAKHKVSRPKIVKDLNRYWHGGATPNALLPHFFKCGAPGVKREPGEAKRGRKRKDEDGPPGMNINRAMRRMFAVAIQRFGKNARRNLKAVYERMKTEFFTMPGQDHLGRLIQLPKEEYAASGYPTLSSFFITSTTTSTCWPSMNGGSAARPTRATRVACPALRPPRPGGRAPASRSMPPSPMFTWCRASIGRR